MSRKRKNPQPSLKSLLKSLEKKKHLKLECASPAKLNLFFRVLKKREDGYHEIASLYQAIDLFDHLCFEVSDRFELHCNDPMVPLDETNLIYLAFRAFQKRFPIPSVHATLEKKIPMQAGLGGGSSNAATTLWALNELFDRPARIQDLIEIGSKIGSDVPFFFSNGTAFCTGRGEVLAPFNLPLPLQGFIAKSRFGLSTPKVYGATLISELPLRDPKEVLKNYPTFFNDLEYAAFRVEPKLREIYAFLKKSFKTVVLAGSGSAFFCLEGMPKKMEGMDYYPFCSIQRSLWYEDVC